LEIAELTGKDHKNVLRDIKRILKEAEIDQLRFESIFLDSYKREQSCLNLPRLSVSATGINKSRQLLLKILKPISICSDSRCPDYCPD
jgi:phage regulator Rha-like protein